MSHHETPLPARVHVILARDADTAIVIRRGPSKKVCTVGWNRKNDTFQVGQWIQARIYERRCDLSPDGKHFIYFAYNGRMNSATGGSYTAISRAPYLRAIGPWGNGSAWNGGGVFRDNRRYWLNRFPFGHSDLTVPKNLTFDENYPFDINYGGECPGIYYPRLLRDGWELVGEQKGCVVFEKPLRHGWKLRKKAMEGSPRPDSGEGCYYDTHELINTQFHKEIKKEQWSWADLDKNRLVWIEQGKLYAAAIHHKELGEAKLLYDFNPMKYQKIKAPYS